MLSSLSSGNLNWIKKAIVKGDDFMKKTLKITIVFLIVILLFQSRIYGRNNPYNIAQGGNTYYQTVINTKELAIPIFEKMRSYLYYNLGGISVSYPYVLDLVTPEYLDQMAPATYKGMEVGLYTFEKNYHHIYIINNLAVDQFLGTAAHEYAHAWQTENCPLNQNIVLKEGFADWVAYKVLQMDGAINASQNIFYRSDPVYGKGFKIILSIEDRGGIQAVLDYVKTTP